MNLVADQGAEAPVDELVSCQGAFVCKLCRNDQRLEMSIVFTHHFYDCVAEFGLDEAPDFRWVHVQGFALIAWGAQCNRKVHSGPMREHDCVSYPARAGSPACNNARNHWPPATEYDDLCLAIPF